MARLHVTSVLHVATWLDEKVAGHSDRHRAIGNGEGRWRYCLLSHGNLCKMEMDGKLA